MLEAESHVCRIFQYSLLNRSRKALPVFRYSGTDVEVWPSHCVQGTYWGSSTGLVPSCLLGQDHLCTLCKDRIRDTNDSLTARLC